ncbi:MAG: hypothetical protein ACP5QP_03550 [Brevinematia bacterium]
MKLLHLILTIFILIVAFTTNISAENFNTKLKGFGAFILSAVYNPSMSDINSTLESYGFNRVGDVSFGLGGMGFGIVKDKFLIGGTGIGILPYSTEAKINGTNIIAEIGGGYGFFELGYNVTSESSFILSPMLGIGGGSTMLNFSVKDMGTLDFDTVVKNPVSREFSVFYGGFGIELGFLVFGNWEIFKDVREWGALKVESTSSIGLGFKISYVYIFGINDIHVINEPSYSGHNVFASFLVAFGGSTSVSTNN